MLLREAFRAVNNSTASSCSFDYRRSCGYSLNTCWPVVSEPNNVVGLSSFFSPRITNRGTLPSSLFNTSNSIVSNSMLRGSEFRLYLIRWVLYGPVWTRRTPRGTRLLGFEGALFTPCPPPPPHSKTDSIWRKRVQLQHKDLYAKTFDATVCVVSCERSYLKCRWSLWPAASKSSIFL